VNAGTTLGALVATLVALGLNAMFPAAAIQDWVWRIPFLLSLPLGVLGWYVRSRLTETPEFSGTRGP
jgi:MHS family proline/betaine transporter-like MFS transporter